MPPRKTADSHPIGHLFAIATVRLEQAQSIATEGQNGRLTRSQQRSVQRRLARAIERARTASDSIGEALSDIAQKEL